MGKAIARFLVVFVALSATACGRHEGRTTPASAEELSDAQIVTALVAIHQGEIDEARIAATRTTDVNVQGFAILMQTEHGAAIDRLQVLSREQSLAPQGSELSQKLARDAAETGDQLNASPALRFDAMYLSAQLDAHRQALALFDQVLIPSITGEALRAEAQEERTAAANHLHHVETVRAQVAATQQLQRQRASR